MKLKKTIWLIFTCIVVAGMVLASCGPAEEAEEEEVAEEEEKVVEEEEEEAEEEEEKPTSDTPKYGGTLNVIIDTDIICFDPGVTSGARRTNRLTNEVLVGGNWAKGLAGTGEVDYSVPGAYVPLENLIGRLAESWEIPEAGHIILHIRKGTHYSLSGSEASQLVGGREVTAEDVRSNLQRYCDLPTSLIAREPVAQKESVITLTDKWTVDIKFPPIAMMPLWLYFINLAPIQPPEVVEKYGDMQDWRVSVGSGPFILADFVKGSVATLTRNPNFWMKDPAGPGKGNQLPYMDTLKFLIIPDNSTRMAAIRTAKADWVTDVTWEEGTSLINTTPDLNYKTFLLPAMYIGMRTDKPELPISDKRVRQALMMAIDFEAIKEGLYSGQAEILAFPIGPLEGWESAYYPLEELPESVQALYSNDPERAKQLLAEAGYSEGFTTNIVCQSTTTIIDTLSVIADMWSKINVTLEIQPKEYAVYSSFRYRRTHEEMVFNPGPSVALYNQLLPYRGMNLFNPSYVSDPHVEEVYEEMINYNILNQAKVFQLFHDLMPYVYEQAWYIPMPAQYNYVFWWPWVKNYHGELYVRHDDKNVGWMEFVWIDQDLKEEMTGRR